MPSTQSQGVRKLRAKYVSKACVSCRRRKLKCSGNEPCQRCSSRGQSCLFSDDQSVVADYLQNSSTYVSGDSIRSEKESSPSRIETRMKRMETMLEVLVKSLPGGSNRESTEPQESEDGECYQGETTFQAPIDAFNANLASLRQQLGCQPSDDPISYRGEPLRISVSSPSSSISESLSTISFGSRKMPFPRPADYTRYLEFFFEDINACHACVNEADFRARSQKLLANRSVNPSDVCFLALNYIIFACTDILTDLNMASEKSRLPGWQWFSVSDSLMGKRKISGTGDLSLIQYLVYEAFYLTHADKGNAAYNVIGLACRLCFQFGLHQQNRWGTECTDFSRHMRQRLFWNVYFVDRRISLSCGRPYGIRDTDIHVDKPAWIDDKVLHPDRDLPSPDPDNSCNIYLSCMLTFAKFAGEIWDQVFSGATIEVDNGETIAMLDARIKYWMETSLVSTPLLPKNHPPTKRHLWQQSLVRTRINHLRLLLRRRKMVSLCYDAHDASICGDLAKEIVEEIHAHASEITKPSSFRFHMAISLGGAVVILATLLCRDLSAICLEGSQPTYAKSFRAGIAMLRDLAINLHAARRLMEDLKDIINVVELVLNNDRTGLSPRGDSINVDPRCIDNIFPYSAIYIGPDIQLPNMDTIYPDPPIITGSIGNGAGDHDILGSSWNSWDDEFLSTQQGPGIPWI